MQVFGTKKAQQQWAGYKARKEGRSTRFERSAPASTNRGKTWSQYQRYVASQNGQSIKSFADWSLGKA